MAIGSYRVLVDKLSDARDLDRFAVQVEYVSAFGRAMNRVYSIDESMADRLRSEVPETVLDEIGLGYRGFVTDEPPETMAVRSLSLAVAQKCNLACTYCYAQEGSFGSEPKNMDRAAARRSVDLLFEAARPGESVNLAFLGGEPLVNRALIRECTSGRIEPAFDMAAGESATWVSAATSPQPT